MPHQRVMRGSCIARARPGACKEKEEGVQQLDGIRYLKLHPAIAVVGGEAEVAMLAKGNKISAATVEH